MWPHEHLPEDKELAAVLVLTESKKIKIVPIHMVDTYTLSFFLNIFAYLPEGEGVAVVVGFAEKIINNNKGFVENWTNKAVSLNKYSKS